MTVDISPPPAVVEFIQENGYDRAIKIETLSDKDQDVFKIYSDKDIFLTENDKIDVSGLVYIILKDGKIRFANEQEVLHFLIKN